jgi:tRNA-2-methylthio-N6-dimethylallyladenosine synthase
MDDDLIDAHGELDVLMPYLHLPVQAGSDRVLKAMNRGHTAEDYLRIFEKVRKVRPDIALASDFIVGFPGETDQDFEDTMSLVREVKYASAFSFKYSRRPGTPGAEMFGQVDEDVKNERLQRLQALLREQQIAFNASCVGKTLPVLFTNKGRLDGQIGGKAPYLQSVHCDGPESLIGQIVDVEIIGSSQNSLTGKLKAS